MSRTFWLLASSAVVLALAGCASSSGGSDIDAAGNGADTGAGDGGGPDATPGFCNGKSDCPDDGIFCNGGYDCVDHKCVATGIPTCNDGVSCTMDFCDPVSDSCQHTPDNTACPPMFSCVPIQGCQPGQRCEMDAECDDGNFCNGTESCVGHVCQASTPPNCNDNDACTADRCDMVMKKCVNTPIDYTMSTDVMNCGSCGHICPTGPHATAKCGPPAGGGTSVCGLTCDATFVDTDPTMVGCECQLDVTDPSDTPGPLPDPTMPGLLIFRDANCDGIDGNIAGAIFVSPRGSDSNAGTMAQPKATLQAAINAAGAANPKKAVYAAFGTYNGSITLVDGVGIYGGYDDSAGPPWKRGAAFTTTIRGTTTTAVFGQNLSAPIELQLLTITSADATGFGGSSYGVRLANAANIKLHGVTIIAGNGTNGTGRNNSAGYDGSTGAVGGGGNAAGATAAGSSSCGAPGGAGGAAVSGSNDGHGGQPGSQAPSGGMNGGGGSAATGYGQCGIPGTNGNSAPDNATPGSPGPNGANGPNAAIIGTASAGGLYNAPTSGDGIRGFPGGGGGGGGSGSGDSSLCFLCCNDHTSGFGGGGGGGGCPGSQGFGGHGGGGSFAIISVTSGVHLDHVSMTTGRGGDGGDGGDGGSGGGFGGGGGNGTGNGGSAGNGAPGKNGGPGGWAGSGTGGTGGPSICIFYTGTVPSETSDSCTLGGGGSAGNGGTNVVLHQAPNGVPGVNVAARAAM